MTVKPDGSLDSASEYSFVSPKIVNEGGRKVKYELIWVQEPIYATLIKNEDQFTVTLDLSQVSNST